MIIFGKFIAVRPLIYFLVCFAIWIAASHPTFAQPHSERLRAFENYLAEYRNLSRSCGNIASQGRDNAELHWVNCIWRNDQILLQRFGLYEILYHSAYERYADNFELARAAIRNRRSGVRNWIEIWAESKVDLDMEYETIQWGIVIRLR